MARKTYFVVQPFIRGTDGEVIPDQPMEAQSEEQARRKAYRMSEMRTGVIAFSRTGDPSTGGFEDAVEIVRFGEVQVEALQA